MSELSQEEVSSSTNLDIFAWDGRKIKALRTCPYHPLFCRILLVCVVIFKVITFQIRKRRLARLAALENGSPSNSVSPPLTPVPQSPLNTVRNQSPPVFEKASTPDLEGFAQEKNVDNDKESKLEAVFQVPSKPIDMPSSSRHNRPPQRSDSETSSIHMEVDEASGCADKAGGNTDIDSGIENMEVSFVLCFCGCVQGYWDVTALFLCYWVVCGFMLVLIVICQVLTDLGTFRMNVFAPRCFVVTSSKF